MADTGTKKRIAELYEAFKKKNKYVAKLCRDPPPEDPLQKISDNYNNTFLHMAIRFRQKDVVKELVEMLPPEGKDRLSDVRNMERNTILHEIASRDDMKDVAEKVVQKYKDKDLNLLFERNDLRETPIFCAARYGQIEMFKFLAEKMNLKEKSEEDVKQLLRREGGTTVLHISITTECFKLAYFIAGKYKCLIAEKDQNSMTALQYLACNPTAFERNRMKMTQRLKEEPFLSKYTRDISKGNTQGNKEKENKQGNKEPEGTKDSSSCPLQDLYKLLVKEDTSWHQANGGSSKTKESKKELSQKKDGQVPPENEGQNSNKSKKSNVLSKKSDVSPLFLAIISNIQEIVEEILVEHPRTLEYTNNEGMNILQVAIHYRHIKIFDVLVNSQLLPRKLLSKTDNDENSLLHMFGTKMQSQVSERMQNPAFELRKELLFFQKVKSACKMHLTQPINNAHQTAEELFATTNVELHGRAKEWLMRAAENCTILSIFIATIAFAAAYTVPGGSDGSTGIPILHSKPFFVVFILADVISVTFALISVGIFLSILTSSFPLQQFETYLFKKLRVGITFMILSISMMAVAFGATIVLIMEHNWKNAVWVVVAFLPVPLSILSYTPPGSEILGSCTEFFKKNVVRFLKGVGIVVVIVLCLLFLVIPYVAFKGLRKTYEFITCKSQPKSPQPAAARMEPSEECAGP